MHYIDFELDEDYPFRISHPTHRPLSDGLRLEIPVYGNATIAIVDRDDWYLDELTLKASNGKFGDKCHSWDEPVEVGTPLFEVVKTYLETVARERVETEIAAYFAELHESWKFDEGKERAKARSGGYE